MKDKGLTAKQVQHIQARSVRFEVPAGPPIGLYLVVYPTGGKSWAFRYRWRGRTRKLTFNQAYPDMSLAAARAEAQSKLDDLKRDVDPAVIQKVEEQEKDPNSAKAVAEEWLDRAVKRTATYGEVKRILNREVLPIWRDKFITEIGRPDVLRLIDAITDRGAPVLANRTLSIVQRWFRWAIERGYIQVSPAAVMRQPNKEITRDRVLTHEELAAVWTAAPDLGFPFGGYFRFLILTGQRRQEAARVRWAHADIESDPPLWTLPKQSTKSKKWTHDVPLAPATQELLKALPRFVDDETAEVTAEGKAKIRDYIFTTTGGRRPISGFSKAKIALDKKILERRKKEAETAGEDPDQVEDLADWRIHDLRRTMTTWMADNGVAPHVLAAILNHSPGSTMGITAVYARSRWAKEKREALNAWAAYVVSLVREDELVRRLAEFRKRG